MPTPRSIASAAALLAALTASGPSLAGLLTNGDFEASPDFTGWTTDLEQLGGPTTGGSPDFQLVTSGAIGSGNRARLETEYPGDDPTALFVILAQALPTSVSPGHQLAISFDWEFGGESSPPDEALTVGLYQGGSSFDANGIPGFLLERGDGAANPNYGSGSFSAVLSPSFNNAAGWTIEFQLGPGFDGNGSYLLVDNVSVTEQAVPLPATLALLLPGLGLIGAVRRRARA
jgi:hypothetical protein